MLGEHALFHAGGVAYLVLDEATFAWPDVPRDMAGVGDTVEFADGRLLNVNGPSGRGPTVAAPAGSAVAAAGPPRTDIYGTWMLVPANRPTSGPQPMLDFLTPAGQAAVAAYDPFTDDPTYRCDPVAIRRVWFAPGTPLAIRVTWTPRAPSSRARRSAVASPSTEGGVATSTSRTG